MKAAKHKHTALQQICNLIPGHMVPNLAREYGVEEQWRTFSPWSHVVTMLYAQLSHSLSLNDVVDSCHNHRGARQATPPSRAVLHENSPRYSSCHSRGFRRLRGNSRNGFLNPGKTAPDFSGLFLRRRLL